MAMEVREAVARLGIEPEPEPAAVEAAKEDTRGLLLLLLLLLLNVVVVVGRVLFRGVHARSCGRALHRRRRPASHPRSALRRPLVGEAASPSTRSADGGGGARRRSGGGGGAADAGGS